MLAKSLFTLLAASLAATAAPLASIKRGEAPDPATDIIWTKNYSDYEKLEEIPDPIMDIIWIKNYNIIWTKNYSDYKKREKTPDPATNIIWTKNYGDYEKA